MRLHKSDILGPGLLVVVLVVLTVALVAAGAAGWV
jgi:hypothetical protein